MKNSNKNLGTLDNELTLDLIKQALKKQKTVRIRFLGTSMMPLINDGEMIVLKDKSPYSIKYGEIVVFNRGNEMIGHRVIWKVYLDKLYFLTKGDNTVSYDFPVPADAIYGKVILSNFKKDGIPKISLKTKLFFLIGVLLLKFESKISTRKLISTVFNKMAVVFNKTKKGELAV